MKFVKYASAAFLFGFLSMQCSFDANSNEMEEDYKRTYDVEEINEVYLEGGYNVYLIQGGNPSFEITSTDEDDFRYIDVDYNDGELSVEITKARINFSRITLYITVEELEVLHIEGGVKLKTKGYLETKDLSIDVEGGAKIEMELRTENLKATGEGGVLFEFSGVAENFDARISGAGHLDADMLKTEQTSFRIEGVGTGSVYAEEELDAKIEGVGKISYKGDPVVHKSIEGIGRITRD